MLVGIKYDGLLLLLYFNRNDFVLELASLDGSNSLLLRSQCQLVLHLAGNAVLLSYVLCSDTHVVAVEDVPQTIVYHQVDHGNVVHTSAPTSFLQNVRCGGHGLSAANQNNLVIAGLDELSAQAHAAHRGCTNLVYGDRRGGDRQTSAYSDLTADVLALTALQHAAGEGLVDVVYIDACLLDSSLSSGYAEGLCSYALEGLAVRTDRGSLSRTNINIHLPNSPFSSIQKANENKYRRQDRF